MDTHPTPEPQAASSPSPDPAPELQREIYLQLVHELLAMLPPPVDTGPDKRASLDHRIKTVTDLVAAMLPATAEEADLAVRAVAAGAHASDCLRQAVQQAAYPATAMKLRAQAASMGREARGYRGLLLRLQAARERREADDATREAAAWTEHCVAGLMTQGFEEVPLDQAVAADTAARDARLEAEADRYAKNHPRRAQLIRRHRGVAEKCEFGLPAPELVRAIVSGDSKHLRAATALPELAR